MATSKNWVSRRMRGGEALPGVLKANTRAERQIEPPGRGGQQGEPEPCPPAPSAIAAPTKCPPNRRGVPQPCPGSGDGRAPGTGTGATGKLEALRCQLLWVLRVEQHARGCAEHRHPSAATVFCLAAPQPRNAPFPLFPSLAEPRAFSSHGPCFPASPASNLALFYLQS